jgi:spermidine/putrescine transport system permease protein
VIPDLLGGAKTVLLGNVLQQQFGPSRDWPFGAALATVSIFTLAVAVVLYSRKTKEEWV